VADWLLQFAPDFYYEKENSNVIWVISYEEFVNWIENNDIPDVVNKKQY
jgi:hypothetical protein